MSVRNPENITLDPVIASDTYHKISEALEELNSDIQSIEMKLEKRSLTIPKSALAVFSQILKEISSGYTISIVENSQNITTQEAAKILGCSRPFVVKLIDNGILPSFKIGKHRRINVEHVLMYQRKFKSEQKNAIIEIMQLDEKDNPYTI